MKDIMKTKITRNIGSARMKPTAASLPLRVKSILVPLDFSPPSMNALHYAAAFARQFKAKLTLLHVVEPVATPDFAASFPLALENDKLMAVANHQLEGVVKAARIPRG